MPGSPAEVTEVTRAGWLPASRLLLWGDAAGGPCRRLV